MGQEFNQKHPHDGMANNYLYLQVYGLQGSLQGSGSIRDAHPTNVQMHVKNS